METAGNEAPIVCHITEVEFIGTYTLIDHIFLMTFYFATPHLHTQFIPFYYLHKEKQVVIVMLKSSINYIQIIKMNLYISLLLLFDAVNCALG